MTEEALPPLDRLANLDFEGSCYPSEGKSFPVEVALVRLKDGRARSWLIRQHPDWVGWTWDPQAEEAHGLSRRQLESEGRPAAEVLDELAAFAEGCEVVSDSESDDHWLKVLAEASGREPPFEIGSSAHVLKLWGIEGQTQEDPVWQEADEAARERFPKAHLAEPDAQRGAEILRRVAERFGYA